MTFDVRIVEQRAVGRDIRCPRCGRKLGVTIIPGGRHQIACPRCHACVQFETWEEDEPPPVGPVPVTRNR